MTAPTILSSTGATAASAVDSDSRSRAGMEGFDWLALAVLLGLAFTLGLATLMLRPDLHSGAGDVLFSDAGYNLYLVDRLLVGERLYSEVAFQYGPLPPLVHTGFAALFGNTLRTYHALLLLVTLVNVGLGYLVIRRCASRTAALVVVGLGLTPSVLIPGSLLGSFSVSSYVPFERTILLLGMLLWTPPAARSRRRAGLLGLVIGSWQLVRFGGGVFLGIAVVAADLLALWWTGDARRAPLRRWFKLLLSTVGAAVAVELLLVGWALLTLPGPVARDTIWPTYILGTYAAWVTPDVRWPHFSEPRLLIGQYLSPLLGGALGVGALILYLRGRRGRPSAVEPAGLAVQQIRLLIPLLFYALAVVGYFRMAFHFFQFAWLLVIPAAWAFERAGRWGRLALVTLLLPCFALNLRTIFLSSPPGDLQAMRTPRGEVLWTSPEGGAEIAALGTLATRDGSRGETGGRSGILIVPLGAGFYHQYGVENSLRQPWFLGTFHRPYDDPALLASLGRTGLVAFRTKGAATTPPAPCEGDLRFSLEPETCATFAARLGDPSRVGSFWVYRVR